MLSENLPPPKSPLIMYGSVSVVFAFNKIIRYLPTVHECTVCTVGLIFCITKKMLIMALFAALALCTVVLDEF